MTRLAIQNLLSLNNFETKTKYAATFFPDLDKIDDCWGYQNRAPILCSLRPQIPALHPLLSLITTALAMVFMCVRRYSGL